MRGYQVHILQHITLLSVTYFVTSAFDKITLTVLLQQESNVVVSKLDI